MKDLITKSYNIAMPVTFLKIFFNTNIKISQCRFLQVWATAQLLQVTELLVNLSYFPEEVQAGYSSLLSGCPP